jgi:hypothetical protein
MTDTDSNATPNATPNSHLGFRIAVGAVGLVLLAMFVMLGSVAMKQSATQKSLETREANQESAPSESARE